MFKERTKLNVKLALLVSKVIFSSFLGAKVRSEIYEAFENIYPLLKGFKKA